ncbi:unnamed protein product [Microthlaspi erraticum]|uniref:LOB domain-containing protein n=1 Tax=Microthlaspi erraticum TaxID=1685480 RepID=A0A6D2HUL3_9BRAS|nr:unnamed protein product [Microthlaspi erraticum]
METTPTPCAACKHLRRRCTQNCVFAPYFPASKQDKYLAVHKVFGASHVATYINDIHPSQREYAMDSLAFEAQARIQDPVHGCSRLIHNLQCRLKYLQDQLRIAKNELASYNIVPTQVPPPPTTTYQQNPYNPNYVTHLTRREPQGFELMQQTLERQTQQSHGAMIVCDKKDTGKDTKQREHQ